MPSKPREVELPDGSRILVPGGWRKPKLWTRLKYHYYKWRNAMRLRAFDRRVKKINRRKSKLPTPSLGITHEQYYHRNPPATDAKLIKYARKVTYRRKP